ncbi:FAD-dependent oxidoreductase [Vibrio sp. JC009]|uniref:FAD-dependent oxidoreductase n=1 Tax=Vibrio sp. JC009 TaxID=2912314 RepID=UPI0023B1847B|nr:FAD-dependent oxidoreductase [Vibrio sp. JC009]WED23366.1 FAD-dependent oxidoreductase [Vibrio sp. JC009]
MPVRKIDTENCIGCGTCVESCPMDVFRLDTSENQPEASPCSNDCPLGLNQREWHYLIKMNQLDDAAAAIQAAHPMPSITGRVCPHPCESACTRSQVDEAININGLEQYLGDYLLENGVAVNNSTGEKVAIIGSGPAGLSAAYNLAMKGYQVTVFEKDQKPGGLMQYSIPAFRLSDAVIDQQMAFYKKMGIEFRTGVMVGKDISKEELVSQGYKAFVAATGAAKPLQLNVPGADAQGIDTAIDFLKRARMGEVESVPAKVAVIGGGSVALDAARTAIRYGAKEVHVVCLERIEPGHKDNMLALAEEIREAQEEGVIFHTKRSVNSFNVSGEKVSGLELIECHSVRDDNFRFSPDLGTEVVETLDADGVILAIGQSADAQIVPQEFAVNERGYIKADGKTLQVESDMFAAGDGVTGPTTVVQALASGKHAALMVDRYIQGQELEIPAAERKVAKNVPQGHNLYTEQRQERSNADAQVRVTSFDETMQSLTHQQAQREAERCLTCGSRSTIAYVDDCQVCRLCAHYCPADCIEISDGAYVSSLHNFDVVTLGKALNN